MGVYFLRDASFKRYSIQGCLDVMQNSRNCHKIWSSKICITPELFIFQKPVQGHCEIYSSIKEYFSYEFFIFDNGFMQEYRVFQSTLHLSKTQTLKSFRILKQDIKVSDQLYQNNLSFLSQMTSFAETMTFLSRNRLQYAPTTITNHYFNILPYNYIKNYPFLNGKMVLMVWCGHPPELLE